MKITVEIPERDLKDIMRFSGEKKKGPAIARFLTSKLMLERRRELSEEIRSGRWSVDLPDWRETRTRERHQDQKLWER